jgi:Lon protease-like protein
MSPHARIALVSLWLVGSSVSVLAQPEPNATQGQSTLPATIPIFPLQDVMLFPGVFRPLHIFEPRYREMLLYALAGDRIVGMVMLQPGHERDYYGQPPIYPVGCAGVIANVEELPDGRYNVVLHGLTKFRVKSEERSFGYRIAEIDAIPEILNEDQQSSLRQLRPRLLAALATIAPGAPGAPIGQSSTPEALSPEELPPEELPDVELVNGLAQFLPMEPSDRLELLELDGALARAEALIERLAADAP